MTEVRFYHLQAWPLERALPKLLEKVLERGHRVVLLTDSSERAEALNGHLWTYEERAWLPHGTAGDGHAGDQPIYLTAREENPNGADVLVLVDGVESGQLDRFAIVIDMFNGQDETAVAAARERWRRCLERGFTLTYWQQTERGAWEQKAAAG